MTDHKPLPVKGYTSQTEQNIALVNEGKELEERYLRWLDKVTSTIGPSPQLVTGKYRIQEGFMWSVRAIFNPQRIKLPEDTP